MRALLRLAAGDSTAAPTLHQCCAASIVGVVLASISLVVGIIACITMFDNCNAATLKCAQPRPAPAQSLHAARCRHSHAT